MPNGKPGDNPVTDTVIHGLHPFSEDIEPLVIAVHTRNPGVFNDLGWCPFDWEKGLHLDSAKKLLETLLENHGDPVACRQAIQEYRLDTEKEEPTPLKRPRPWWKFWG